MNQVLYNIDEVIKMIADGQTLILAGDEKALSQLPSGSWIAGTIPYFMGECGGEFSQEKIYVTTLPEFVSNIKIKVYDENTIKNVYSEAPDHGFSIIIVSALSPTHLTFSVKAPTFDNFATRPLIGWISGVFLEELGKVAPKIYNGTSAKAIENGAVVLSVDLPKNKAATLDIINMFKPGTGDSLFFEEDGFSAKDVIVNGKKQNFVSYLKENNIDTKPPLVANMYGAHINTSFQAVNEEEKRVDFYAPVFKAVEYKLAEPVENYVGKFTGLMSESRGGEVYFSCNCILNYLYSELEGKKTGNVTGPITFGEIAYQLMNQTLAYMVIEDI
jgi:Family of unknown function (DUF6976)